jgi:hypothetical protein
MALEGTATVEAPRFSVGRVFSVGFPILFRNILRFLVIIVAVVVPITVLGIGGGLAVSASFGADGDLRVDLEAAGWSGVVYIVFMAVLFVLGYFLIQAAITYGTLQALRGETAGIGACLRQGIAVLPRVFGAGLMFFIALGIVVAAAATVVFSVMGAFAFEEPTASALAAGVVAFVVALVLIFLMGVIWWVFVPAIVVERAGPIACFGRSRALTKGHRWGVLGIILLLAVANGIVTALTDLMRNFGVDAGADIIDLVALALFTALTSVLAAVGYYYLRGEKEGVAIEDIVKVFD